MSGARVAPEGGALLMLISQHRGPRHPQWCVGGVDCANGMHVSRIRSVAQTGEELIQVGVGLWLMEVGQVTPAGLVLELSADEEPQHWLVDLAQSRVLVPVLQDLLRVADDSLPPSV